MSRFFPWCLLILAVLLAAWKGAAGSRTAFPGSAREEAPVGPSHEAGAVGESTAAAPTKRPVDGRAAAEAKLRSLLDVRKGEMASVHLPPELTEQLVARVQAASGPAMNPAEGAPAMVGILNPELILELFAGSADEIQGGIDARDESFEWRGERLQITGSASHAEDRVKLDFIVTEGAKSLECITSVPPGAVVFLRSAGDRPEGLLLAIGGDARAEMPPGDIGD